MFKNQKILTKKLIYYQSGSEWQHSFSLQIEKFLKCANITINDPTNVIIFSPCGPNNECPNKSAKIRVSNPEKPIKKIEGFPCICAPFISA